MTIAKTTRSEDLISNLGNVFTSLRQHDMRLNPLKCAFAMEAGKFLGFMITQRGVEANLEKCQAILQMKSPGCVKDVQRLSGRLTALSRFLGASAARALPFFNLMKKGIVFIGPRRTSNGRPLGGSSGDPTEETGIRWRLHVDRASNQTSGGSGIILESPAGVIYKQSIKFKFPVSNNQAEYEALLGGLILAREVGATRLEVCSDSQVVTSQVNGSYQARDSLLQKYLEKVKELAKQFEEVVVQHVLRERNTRADLLSKLASTKPGVGNRSLIQGMIKEPAVALHLTKIGPSWMDPITDFLENGKLPEDEKEAKALRREAAKYAIIQGQLFRKGLSQPSLKCLHPDQTDYVLREVHEGCCGHHIGGKALARKLIRAEYYWPSMMVDSKEFFTDKKFMEFLAGLGIKQKFSSVEHPQTNGQIEAANKVVLLGLKKRLDNKKGAWANELASVLWSYRTTEQSSTGEPLSA
ncbi:uncharacterized protein [Arachis hypogaea]|uniref:uncharacterized protein n=1 Tax=Arachis hypogaea TaxID=3818 RepID=UPI003B22135F